MKTTMPRLASTTLLSHIQEFGKRLKMVLITFFVSTVAVMVIPGNLAFFSDPLGSYEPLVGVLLKELRVWALPPEVTLIGLALSDPIELYFQIAVIIGLCVTIPVFAFQLYRFVDPALLPQEKKHVYPFIASVFGLFVAGALFGTFVLFPVFIQSMLPFFTVVGAEPVVSVSDFYSMFLFTAIAAGLLFTLPAWLTLLVKIGLIKSELLTKNRKWLYLILFIVTMLVTPGNAPQENIAFFVPLMLLFEAGILFGKKAERKRQTFFGDHVNKP